MIDHQTALSACSDKPGSTFPHPDAPPLHLQRGIAQRGEKELDLREAGRLRAVIEFLLSAPAMTATLRELAEDWFHEGLDSMTPEDEERALQSTRQVLYQGRITLAAAFGPSWLVTVEPGARPPRYCLFSR